MPAVPIKKVLKLLKENGFYELDGRQEGSHHRYTDGKGHYVTVAYHKKSDTVFAGTYNSILKQMGLK